MVVLPGEIAGTNLSGVANHFRHGDGLLHSPISFLWLVVLSVKSPDRVHLRYHRQPGGNRRLLRDVLLLSAAAGLVLHPGRPAAAAQRETNGATRSGRPACPSHRGWPTPCRLVLSATLLNA